MFITGGFIDNDEEPLTRAQKFSLLTEEYTELPALMEARRDHASIVSGKYLYTFGGKTTGDRKYSRSIEMLNLLACQAWEMLITYD